MKLRAKGYVISLVANKESSVFHGCGKNQFNNGITYQHIFLSNISETHKRQNAKKKLKFIIKTVNASRCTNLYQISLNVKF